MKKHLFFFAVAALALAASCEREIAEPEVMADSMAEGIAMTFRAYTDPGTRTELDGVHVLWSSRDAISVFYGSDNNEFTASNTEPASTVDFSGVISDAHAADGPGSKVFAVYPYSDYNSCDGETVTVSVPPQQEPLPNSFGLGDFPSVAVTTTDELRFYNVAGGVKLRFSRDNVSGVTIISNNEEAISGKVKVSFDADGVPSGIEQVGYPYDYIWVFPGGGDEFFRTDCDYYVSMIPGTIPSGLTFSIEVNFVDAHKEYARSFTVKRNVFGSVKGFDRNVTYDTFVSWYPSPVDLGLSVLWGSVNLGGENPEESGWYYAWGETEPKDLYGWGNYLWCEGTNRTLTKYNTGSAYGVVDNLKEIEPEDDPATVKLNSMWRMPTASECQELLNNCEWEWTNEDGVDGYLVTSKVEGYTGNSIFLPAAGRINDEEVEEYGTRGYYWSSSLAKVMSSSKPDNAFCIRFGNSAQQLLYGERSIGYPIRPVKEKLTMKLFAKKFVEGLEVWEETVGAVESDDQHQMADGTAWYNAHFIPVGRNGGEYDYHTGNQHDMRVYKTWTFNIDGHLYNSFEAWEIAARGLLEMCTAEGQEFYSTMTGPNASFSPTDGARFDKMPVPVLSKPYRAWGPYPWFEDDGVMGSLTEPGGAPVTEVDVLFMLRTCAWALKRAYDTEDIVDYVTYGPNEGDLYYNGYEGYVCSMRQLLVLLRIYKYLLDNDINENVFSAIRDVMFDYDLYGI